MIQSANRASCITYCALSLLLASCGNGKESHIEDFNKDIYIPEYASGFNIKGAEGKESVMLSTINPWQGADSVTTQLLILRNGESAPDGFTGQVLEGDAKRIVTMSTTYVAMLDALGEVGRIVGVSGADFIFNDYINEHRSEIGDVGYDSNVNYELILALEPDLVLLYGVNGANIIEPKLKELGIPYMYVGDYLEESPLGKAEWMVALSETIGKREAGEKIFSGIPVRYNALKEKVSAECGMRNAELPKVMLNTPYGDSWFMPSSENYAIRLIKDAGGEYVYSKNTGNSSVPIDLEEAYRLCSEADVWLNVGAPKSLAELKEACPKFADTRCFLGGKVYNNTARSNASGGNDYFESGIVHPDIMLRDLIKIFHPELVEDDFVYYKQLE